MWAMGGHGAGLAPHYHCPGALGRGADQVLPPRSTLGLSWSGRSLMRLRLLRHGLADALSADFGLRALGVIEAVVT